MIIEKKIEFSVGGKTLSLESGQVAKQSDGAVWARYGDTIVLVTVVASKEPKKDMGFFPLFIEYREQTAAAGKIPGGFFKREGRPTEQEILTSRVIDRSIRPLFPDNYLNEVQVVAFVLSADQENSPDIPALIGASAALCSSPIPFKTPVSAVRVGIIDGEYVINPTIEDLSKSSLNLFISGTEDSILMVEGSGDEVTEEELLKAIEKGYEAIKQDVSNQKSMLIEKPDYPVFQPDAELQQQIESLIESRIQEIFNYPEKKAREDFYDTLKQEALSAYEEDEEMQKEASSIFKKTMEERIRRLILESGKRLDGRDSKQVRPISIKTGLLPRTHGSALFTRGQTQCLASVTLGTSDDQQRIDGLYEETSKRFMLHYNFPSFSVGETSPFRGPSRREIGHGFLAEKSLDSLLPGEEECPYTLRIVANILESNGSSSMATVCAGNLALMDAGINIKKHVAGIASGMIKEGDRYILLTDIAGEEDHFGDMDLKVAGTEKGITGFQMDVKSSGLTSEIISQALIQSREARMEILNKMKEALAGPRDAMSAYAPKMISLKINKAKIGLVIGPGGKNIRRIIEETGAEIDISDDGTVKIFSPDGMACEAAAEEIRMMTEEPEVGKIYEGKVVKNMAFGAFVQFLPGQEGLVHISELSDKRVAKVEDVVNEGDTVKVKLIGIDNQGRVKLSIKQAV